MATFDEILLDPLIMTAAEGGPEAATSIFSTPYGIRQRFVNRYDLIQRWSIDFALLTETQRSYLDAFFRAGYGMAIGFRCCIPDDYKATAEVFAAPGGTQPPDGVRTVFNLYKSYSRPGSVRRHVRRVTKPVGSGLYQADGVTARPNTVTVYSNGTAVAATIDTVNGTATFAIAPLAGVTLTWTGEFDTPMAFNVDWLKKRYDVTSDVGQLEMLEILPAELGITY